MNSGGGDLVTGLEAATTPSAIGLRSVLESLPTAVYTTDADGRLTYFNAAAAKLSGRTPELGTDRWCVTWKLFLPDGTPLQHDQCPMAAALRGDEVPNGIEYIAERPDGSRFWFSPFPLVLRDSTGRITGGINLLADITNRKNAESGAKEQLGGPVETTPECVNVIAADGTLLFMNPPGLEMIGAPSAELVVGKSVYTIVAPEDRENFRNFHAGICGGKKGSLQFDIVGLNGVRRHMETHAAPLQHTDGTIVHLAVTHDVVQRTRTERAALLLSAIVDSSDDAIVSKDLDGIITSWNPSAERIFGYTADEAIGRPVASLIIPADRQNEEPQILSRLKRGERVDHFETIRRRKDGTLLNVSVTISPVRDASGKIIGASKIARDITGQKRMEIALVESEARFRQLAEAMPQMVWTASTDGNVDYYNGRWYEFAGLAQESAGDANLKPSLHPEDVERASEEWHNSVASGAPYNIEYRLWDTREKRWRWFVDRALPVRDPNGAITKWFGTCTDIDRQKRIQDDLRRANRDLEQFAFSASHDLQEPLRAIKIYTQLLSARYAEKLEGDAQTFMRFVFDGAARMETLVRDLLAYTQVKTLGKTDEIANAGEALDGALANLSAAIAETGASITADVLPEVRAQSLHLQQLFQNLVGNAIKYKSRDRIPQIHVGAARQGEHWVFSVADNGIGVERDYHETIFGLFKRLHHGADYAGTGIGLAICQRIVDRYDGRIWVDSEPGHGSIFRFTIPV